MKGSNKILPESDEDVCERLEGGEESEDDPVHHPFHLEATKAGLSPENWTQPSRDEQAVFFRI